MSGNFFPSNFEILIIKKKSFPLFFLIFNYNKFNFFSIPLSTGSIGTLIDCRRQPQPQPSTITERSKFIDDNDSIDYFNINNNNNNKYSDEIDEEFDDFDCPEKFGYYPDEKNCSKYHLCDHGKSRLKSCDDGLVFSTILKTCDWPYNVHCNLANGDRGLPFVIILK